MTHYTFTTFFQKTFARFHPTLPPDREPDFLSPSGSVYWNVHTGVVRASNHWSGQCGCEDIASCRWLYEGRASNTEWVTGYCAFDGFRAREWGMLYRPATPAEITLACTIKAQGGHLGQSTAPWIHTLSKGLAGYRPELAALVAQHPTEKWFGYVPATVLHHIINGQRVPVKEGWLGEEDLYEAPSLSSYAG